MVVIKTGLLEFPSAEQFDRINKDLNIDVNEYSENEIRLLEWLDRHENLSQVYEKNVVLNFLRLCKNDLGKAKAKYEGYIAARSFYPEIFQNRWLDVDNFKDNLIHRCLCVVPYLTEECYRVLVLRIPKDKMTTSDFQECLKYLLLIADFSLANNCDAGLICVVDFAGFSISCISQLSISFIRSTIYLLLKIYPSRMRGVHLLNVNRLIRPFISMVKTLLPSKVKQRLIIHSGYSELFERFPVKYIPKDYGGSGVTCEENSENWRRFFLENKTWIERYDKMSLGNGN
ncbi:hypothetical protein Trydic_g23272 [Trypoxylus dichotomus]